MLRPPAGYIPITDLATPMVARLVAALGIPEMLRSGPVPLPQLARDCGVDGDALCRTLRFLVSRGVFEETDGNTFALNDAAEHLLPGAPDGIASWLDINAVAQVVGYFGLSHAVRTGGAAWAAATGRSFWDYLHSVPDRADRFDVAMADTLDLKRAAVRAYDWSELRRIVDVGGGSGALIGEILKVNQACHGTVIDLPSTADRARAYLRDIGMDERTDVVAQDFFTELPSGGDAYVLCGVMADWPDADAVRILRRCRDAIDDNGRIVIIEHPTDPRSTKFVDMSLLMLLLVGGKIRTLDELKQLGELAGLEISQVTVSDHDQSVIELRRHGSAS